MSYESKFDLGFDQLEWNSDSKHDDKNDEELDSFQSSFGASSSFENSFGAASSFDSSFGASSGFESSPNNGLPFGSSSSFDSSLGSSLSFDSSLGSSSSFDSSFGSSSSFDSSFESSPNSGLSFGSSSNSGLSFGSSSNFGSNSNLGDAFSIQKTESSNPSDSKFNWGSSGFNWGSDAASDSSSTSNWGSSASNWGSNANARPIEDAQNKKDEEERFLSEDEAQALLNTKSSTPKPPQQVPSTPKIPPRPVPVAPQAHAQNARPTLQKPQQQVRASAPTPRLEQRRAEIQAQEANQQNLKQHYCKAIYQLMSQYGYLDLPTEIYNLKKFHIIAIVIGICSLILGCILGATTQESGLFFFGIIPGVVVIIALCVHAATKKKELYQDKLIIPTLAALFNIKDILWKSTSMDSDLYNVKLTVNDRWNRIYQKYKFTGKYRNRSFKMSGLTLKYESQGKNSTIETIFSGVVFVFPLSLKLPCDLYITENSFSGIQHSGIFSAFRRSQKTTIAFKTGYGRFDNQFRLELVPRVRADESTTYQLLQQFKAMLTPQMLDAFMNVDNAACANTRMIFTNDKLILVHEKHDPLFSVPNFDYQNTSVLQMIDYAYTDCSMIARLLDVILEQTGSLIAENFASPTRQR